MQRVSLRGQCCQAADTTIIRNTMPSLSVDHYKALRYKALRTDAGDTKETEL